MARIAIGGFQHETNTFAPLKATWADFERVDAWPPFVRGPEVIDAVEGFNIPIAGAVLALQTLGQHMSPVRLQVVIGVCVHVTLHALVGSTTFASTVQGSVSAQLMFAQTVAAGAPRIYSITSSASTRNQS